MIGWKHLTTETFVELAKQIHGDKYGYSKVEYKNSNTKVCIICPNMVNFGKCLMIILYAKKDVENAVGILNTQQNIL